MKAGIKDLFKSFPIDVVLFHPRGMSITTSGELKRRDKELKEFLENVVVVKDKARLESRHTGEYRMILKRLKKTIRPIEREYIYTKKNGKGICFIYTPTPFEWIPIVLHVDRKELRPVPVDSLRWALYDMREDFKKWNKRNNMTELVLAGFGVTLGVVLLMLVWVVAKHYVPVLSSTAQTLAQATSALKEMSKNLLIVAGKASANQTIQPP